MINAFRTNKDVLLYFGVWLIIGMLIKPIGAALTVLFILGFKRQNWIHLILLGLWFTLIISDNASGINFTKDIKPVIVVLCFMFVWLDKENLKAKSNWHKFLIPFFIIVGFSWLRNPNPTESLQKSVSLILLFTTVPSLLLSAYDYKGKTFLHSLIWFGWTLLSITLVLSVVKPGTVIYFGRYSGVFRNPNGLGVFVTLFFFLYRVVNDIFPELFKRKDRWLITGVCFLSIIMCGSRGALLAVIIFLTFNQFYKISPYLGFFIMVLAISLANYTLSQLPVIITGLGLQEYFRLETLEDGSGRVVAWEFAIEQIRLSPYIGKGIGFTDYVFQENRIELNLLGHQGNAHNSYLTYWIDTGIFGLASLLIGLLIVFIKGSFQSRLALPICYAFLFMINVESWLIASLNPFTIILVMILTLLYHKKDILLNEEKKAALALS
jgi:O-antigen ligase